MVVNYEQVFQTSTAGQIPSTSATTVTYGFNAAAGPIEYLILRSNVTFGATPTSASFWSLVNSMRVIVNGSVRFDFRAGITASDMTSPDPLSTLVNQIGGRCYENPAGVADREAYCAIPLGMGTTGTDTNTRFEVVVDWAATETLATYSSGTLEWWIQYNDNFQDGCVVASPTSYIHSASSIETVTVKIPTNIPGAVVAGIYIQNDSLADEYDTQGVRCVELGSYGLSADFVRLLNGNLANGLMYAGASVTDQQEYADGLPGALFLPTFGLSNAGEVTLIVATDALGGSTTTTRTYTPVLTLPSASTQQQRITQSTKAIGNTAAAIVSSTLD